MISFKNTFVPFFLFVFLSSLFSCKEKSMEENLIGKWRVSETKFTRGENTPDGLDDLLTDEMMSSRYEFMEDGKFKLQSMRIKDPVKGIWRLNESKKELYYAYEIKGLEYKSVYPIEMKDENTFIIRQDFGTGLGKIQATLSRLP